MGQPASLGVLPRPRGSGSGVVIVICRDRYRAAFPFRPGAFAVRRRGSAARAGHSRRADSTRQGSEHVCRCRSMSCSALGSDVSSLATASSGFSVTGMLGAAAVALCWSRLLANVLHRSGEQTSMAWLGTGKRQHSSSGCKKPCPPRRSDRYLIEGYYDIPAYYVGSSVNCNPVERSWQLFLHRPGRPAHTISRGQAFTDAIRRRAFSLIIVNYHGNERLRHRERHRPVRRIPRLRVISRRAVSARHSAYTVWRVTGAQS